MPYDPDSLNEQVESVDIEEFEGEAEISEIEEMTVSEAYNPDPENSGFHTVNMDNPERECIVVSVPFELEGESVEISDIFPLPESEASWLNPQFKLKKFKEHYGSVPKEGMTVTVSLDEESGFFSIEY
jgi:hypothetical protein